MNLFFREQSLSDKSETYYNRALAILRQNFGDIHPAISECLDALGLIHKQRGNYPAAKNLFREALRVMERVYTAPDHPTHRHVLWRIKAPAAPEPG